MKLRCVLGVSDRAGPSDDSRLTPSPMLPSVPIKTSASRNCPLRDSIPGPHLPLSTLHVGTCVPPRMTRGQTGSLHLICKRLSLLASMPVSLAHNGMDAPRFLRHQLCQSGSVKQPLKPAGASMRNITQVGIDLAKVVFQVHGVDARG